MARGARVGSFVRKQRKANCSRSQGGPARPTAVAPPVLLAGTNARARALWMDAHHHDDAIEKNRRAAQLLISRQHFVHVCAVHRVPSRCSAHAALALRHIDLAALVHAGGSRRDWACKRLCTASAAGVLSRGAHVSISKLLLRPLLTAELITSSARVIAVGQLFGARDRTRFEIIYKRGKTSPQAFPFAQPAEPTTHHELLTDALPKGNSFLKHHFSMPSRSKVVLLQESEKVEEHKQPFAKENPGRTLLFVQKRESVKMLKMQSSDSNANTEPDCRCAGISIRN
eukprot:IDg23400t1